MKVILFALAVLTAGASAAHVNRAESRLIVDQIVIRIINEIREQIVEAGLDPLEIDYESAYFQLPVTDLFSAQGRIEDFVLKGISNIVINNIDFSLITSRLRFTISLPRIAASLGGAEAYVALAGTKYGGEASGTFDIVNIRVSGDVRLNIGVISGVSVRSIIINFTLGGIESDLNVVLFEKDFSEKINNFFGNVIPNFVTENATDINTVLAHYIRLIIESVL